MFARHVSCLVAVVFASTAAAQTSLSWKLARGQTFEVERIIAQKQTVEIQGKQFKQDRQTTWHMRFEVQEADKETFRITAVLVKVEQQQQGSANTELVDPKLGEKMQGSTFSLVVTPAGQVRSMMGYDEFLKKLAGKEKARLKALQMSFPEDALKEVFTDVFGPLPGKEVVPKDSWQRTYVEPIPHFGSLRSTARYIYEGKANDHEKIAYTISTVYQLPKEATLFRIVKGDIQSDKAKGAIHFDASAGRLVKHERTVYLRGTLTVEAMDRQQPLEFISVNEVKLRLKR